MPAVYNNNNYQSANNNFGFARNNSNDEENFNDNDMEIRIVDRAAEGFQPQII